jgi:hypothetical protein
LIQDVTFHCAASGRNGIRVGDIELEDFKKNVELADKHETMIAFMM